MSTDWESTFTSWTKPPSDTEEARCDNAVSIIKKAIAADGTTARMKIDVFAQGSYANNTNVKLNSDVDVCVCDLKHLFCRFPEGTQQSDFGIIDSDYLYSTYKNQIENALTSCFGRREVTRGNKAFDIKSNTYRVEADVLPCFEHRRYTGETDHYGKHVWLSGIEFCPDNGGKIINWPKQHIENGIQKNKETDAQFRKVVRIIKKLNLEMIDAKIEVSNRIPSFLIECLCWNTPNNIYLATTYTEIVKNTIIYLFNATKEYENVKEWGEISELKYLFRPSQTWKLEDVNDWTKSAWNYIGTR